MDLLYLLVIHHVKLVQNLVNLGLGKVPSFGEMTSLRHNSIRQDGSS